MELKQDGVVLFASPSSTKATLMRDRLISINHPFTEVNVDEDKSLASKLNIRVTPIVHVYKSGQLVAKYMVNQLDDMTCYLNSKS